MLEDRIRQSLDAALIELRRRLDAEIHAAATEFLAARNEAQQAAVAEARARALEEAAVERARAVAEAEARVRGTLDELVAAGREEERQRISMEVRTVVEAEAARRLEAALEQERHTRALALADAADRAERAQRAAVADARVRERESALAALGRLLDGVRALDEATTLSGVLDGLTEAAAREAARVAVLVLKGDRLHGWKVRGFGPRDQEPRTLDLALGDAGVIGYAVGAARTATTQDGEAAAGGPGFAHLPADRMGLAVPLLVGGRVVAVVYADGVAPEGENPAVPSGWPEAVEVLARHAARCLEAVTMQRAVQAPRTAAPVAGRAPAATWSSAAEAPGSMQARGAANGGLDEASARRYARLLLSEIKLYHEPAVAEGRRARRLLQALAPHIERARRLYEARVPAAFDARAAVFEQELIRTLAGGDRALLGQPA